MSNVSSIRDNLAPISVLINSEASVELKFGIPSDARIARVAALVGTGIRAAEDRDA